MIKHCQKTSKSDDGGDTSRRATKRHAFNKDVCIFCGDGNEDLRQVTTFTVDDTVRMMATELQDMELLSNVIGRYRYDCKRSEISPKLHEVFQEQIQVTTTKEKFLQF